MNCRFFLIDHHENTPVSFQGKKHIGCLTWVFQYSSWWLVLGNHIESFTENQMFMLKHWTKICKEFLFFLLEINPLFYLVGNTPPLALLFVNVCMSGCFSVASLLCRISIFLLIGLNVDQREHFFTLTVTHTCLWLCGGLRSSKRVTALFC